MSVSASPGILGCAGLQTRRLSPSLGLEVRGLTLSAEMTGSQVAVLTELLSRAHVLVFPEQRFDEPGLRDFVKHFGPLFLHHADEGVLPVDGVPEVLQMRKEPDGLRLFGGSDWHADVTFRNPAGYVSVLYARTIPSIGGDTGFASTIAAFESLSQGLKSMLRQRRAVHSYSGPGVRDHPTETAVHPIVRRHPATGREGLYLNRMFTTRFEGMTAEESAPLINFLTQHMTRAEFTCRVNWQVNQVVMWDNLCTLHYPINDFVGEARLLWRCTAMESGAG